MAKKTFPKSSPSKAVATDKKLYRYVIFIPLAAFIIKMIVMSNIQSGGWLGADGENYTAGIDGLLRDGFFSDEPKLSYWPAGYPLLLWPLAKISLTNFYFFMSIIQSVFFAFASYYLANQLRKSSLKYLTFLTVLLISFNPTLSLSTLAVGYEAPIASCLMMVAGLFLQIFSSTGQKVTILQSAYIAGWFALAVFMQPRFILIGVICLILLIVKTGLSKSSALALAVSLAIMSVSPAIMMYRNSQVIGQLTISTNLGVTMAIGAGDETEGGYDRSGPEVPCEATPPATTPTDNQKVKCVVKWYLQNPAKTINLAFNKSQFFWSPWSGPLVNGTMARNPWLKISPTESIGKTNDGARLVTGFFGKAVSYGWIIGQIFFLFLGFREIRKIGDQEKFIGVILLTPVILSWLTSIGTIGDHRFRIPTMTLSLVLQAAGILAIKKRITKAF
jgi:hypothetical protein